jgi:uncharacterized protein (UPF0333 family)
MDNGGQLSADFLFATLILIIVVGALTNIVSSGIDTANNAQLSEAKAIGENVAEAINSAYTNGEGHYIIVNLNGDLNYILMINNGSISSNATVAVQFNNKTMISYLIPKSANVNQITMKPNETYRINNTNGLVTFSKLS